MKKALILLIFILNIPSFYLISQSAELEDMINLNISLKELSQSTPEKLDSIIKSDKYVIVEGEISSITEIERSGDNLILDIHLINGEWIGLEEVKAYKCIVNVSGVIWEPRFPARTPRTILDSHVLVNNKIMVIGKVVDYVMESSTLTAVLNAEYIRKTQ